MSKNPSQSRIPRIGTASSSRIPIPGSIRPPQFQSKLVKPSSLASGSNPLATPVGFLRPPRSSAVTIARSYSGDKLCGTEPSPFPVLAASTPAHQFKPTSAFNFYRKLELASAENLNDIRQCDTFVVPSPCDVDYADGGKMLVDESLELVSASSSDNLAEPDIGPSMLKSASSNEKVTLSCDGNVTYEVKRSETFVKSSHESLKLGGSRESLNRTRGASLFLTSKSSADSPIADSTRTLETEALDSKRVLCSTMVTDRLANVTQSIPNITQELDAAQSGLPHIKSESILNRTHEIDSPDRLLAPRPLAQRPTRLTFNLNETTNLLHLSDPSIALEKSQVFSSTMHSPMAGEPNNQASYENVLNLTRNLHECNSLADAMAHDTSAGERTLTAEDIEPDDDNPKLNETIDVDENGALKEIFDLSLEEPISLGKEEIVMRPPESRSSIPAKQRFSFGLDLTECTLDCSIELCDSSLSSTKPHLKSPVCNSLTKQGSFEMDESLGILTPDQMKEFLDSTTTNTNNTNNLELQLNTGSHKHGLHHCRIDQTPSPEELPLDPVGVKTDMSDIILPSEILTNPIPNMYQEISQADSDSKTDQMTKSATSKVSNSFITSITSITSLDTGYQGDGEMSRPASRGADHSPSNGPRIKNQGVPGAAAAWNAQAAVAPVPRRQDPMTDSDFFTESDADDVFNRGDRRAQIIDGQLYGPMMQGANVFINQQPQNDDSCMESSGIFTDVENRGDDDLIHRRAENDDRNGQEEEDSADGEGHRTNESDMSPDASTDTISSSNTACSQKKLLPAQQNPTNGANCLQNASLAASISTSSRPSPPVPGGAEKSFSTAGDRSSGSPAAAAAGTQVAEADVTKQHSAAAAAPSPSSANLSATNQSQSAAAASSSSSSSATSAASIGTTAAAKAESATKQQQHLGAAPREGAPSASTDSLSGALVGGGSCSSTHHSNSVGVVVGARKPSSSRKQQKNETNLVLKKHEMSSRAALIKTRLFKDSSSSGSSRSIVGGSALSLDVGIGGDGGGNECENQENKRPPSSGGGPRGPAGGSGSVGNLSFTKKSATPNKWDAVMSKIAENKAVIKKNFSDVKSKISCGKSSAAALVRRVESPASLKSPPSECNSIGNRSTGTLSTTSGSGGGKRTISGSVKRGRTHSKDSQQSSQSDLSLSGGSPKLQPKVSSIRPAKKRDVRTINSSSSDLGPPPKTLGGSQHGGQPQQQQSQPQRASLRVSATLQKRLSPNVTNATIPIVPDQLKGSPIPKRNLTAKRTLSTNNGTAGTQHVVKAPLKDHNRLVGPTPTGKQQAGTISPKSQSKALIRSNPPHATVPPTTNTTTPPPTTAISTPPSVNSSSLHGNTNCTNNNNNNNNSFTSNGTTLAVTSAALKNATNLQRNGTIILEKSSSPLICGGADTSASPLKQVEDCSGVSTSDERFCDRPLVAAAPAPPTTTTTATTTTAAGAASAAATSLNRNLVDISLLNHANRGVEALGVLVQYLVFNLDAFSCPTIKKNHQKTTHDLLETKSMLEEERSTCVSLKQQLLDTTEREAELQELHRCEISKVESCLSEHQRSATNQITALEAELLRKELDADVKLRSCVEEYETKLAEREAELRQAQAHEVELLQRINALSCTENELREKVHSSELEFSERLQVAAMRERDLTEQLKQLNRQMEEMRRAADAREQDLQEKLSLTQDECSFLRYSRNSSEPPQGSSSPQHDLHRSTLSVDQTLTAGSPQAGRLSNNLSHTQILQDEVDSLRCVLDLKQREISELRKQTQEYERDAKDLPGALVKISALESRIEDLQVQLKTKTEEEKELQQKLKLLHENLKQETKVKSRLSQHNEELQWKLKQNSEKFSHVYAELSKSYHENSSILNVTRASMDQASTGVHHGTASHNHSRSSCSERVFEMDDISPPTSPVIKGVVEKSDSVSWVLEMDDEPPEISASRMVRRAGSFRSTSYATSGAHEMKRQKCALNSSLNGGGIQQSSSVGSILKQQDMSPSKGAPGTPRLRSKSVSIKATEPPKKIVRSNSGASSSSAAAVSKPIRMADMPMSWKDPPLYSSSPYAHKRFLNERMENGANKTFACSRERKDLFLEETEFLGDIGMDSPYTRSRAGSFGAGPAEGASEQPIEFFHRDKTPNFKKSKENRGLITCDTTALTESGSDKPAHKKRREFARKNLAGKNNSLPKEAAGEALISGSNSDDEASSSSCLSDDLSSGGNSCSTSSNSSTSSSTGNGSSLSRTSGSGGEGREALVALEEGAEMRPKGSSSGRRRRSSNISLEDALMQKIVASLNKGISNEGNETPMEVSWSEDGDPSESIV